MSEFGRASHKNLLNALYGGKARQSGPKAEFFNRVGPNCPNSAVRPMFAYVGGVQNIQCALRFPISRREEFKLASSIIEEDLKIEGNISSSEGSVEVKGSVVGDVAAEEITIQPSGSIDGALSAKKICIEGKLKGSLKCDDLKLVSTSLVQADVVAQTMTTESGAKVVGKVEITGRQ